MYSRLYFTMLVPVTVTFYGRYARTALRYFCVSINRYGVLVFEYTVTNTYYVDIFLNTAYSINNCTKYVYEYIMYSVATSSLNIVGIG